MNCKNIAFHLFDIIHLFCCLNRFLLLLRCRPFVVVIPENGTKKAFIPSSIPHAIRVVAMTTSASRHTS